MKPAYILPIALPIALTVALSVALSAPAIAFLAPARAAGGTETQVLGVARAETQVPGDDGFGAAVSEEISSRPLLAAQDIYKLAHQSVFGPGHIISSVESAKGHLDKEMASLGPAAPHERAVEDLGGGMARVNLRPFRDSGGSLDGLLDAMLETAKEMAEPGKASPAMAERLDAARGMLVAQGKKVMAEELERIAKEQAEKGYPHVGHSKAYRDAYWPAYRVVDVRHFRPKFQPRGADGADRR
jgi:hypothetical protein